MHFELGSSLLALTLLAASGCPSAQEESKPDAWTQKQLEQATARIRSDIESIRELEFLRPVAVHTTDGAGFLRYAKDRLETLITPEEMALETELARILFLVPPDMDVWEKTLEVLEEQVGGFYDPASESFYLMESFTGKVAEIILAHELTHALDDQLYDIDGGLEAASDNADQAQAYSSVVEGSGTIVMTRWALDHMGDRTMEDLQEAGDFGTEALSDAPPFLWKPLMSSYQSGQSFLDKGYRLGKRKGKSLSDIIAQAFEHPPRSTEQILHPNKYWKESELDEPRVIEQSLEGLPAGWELATERVLGELTLSLIAASAKEREPVDLSDPMALMFLKYTNEAAKGWGGDSLVLLKKGDARIAHLVTVWDSPKDAREFTEALEGIESDWSAAMGALDAGQLGSGVAKLPSEAPDVVRFASWHGVELGEVMSVLETLSWSESTAEIETEATEGGSDRR